MILNGAGVILWDRELKASLLDLRTVRVPHLDATQQKKALDLLEADYVKYSQQAAKFDREQIVAREAKAQAEAEAARAEVADRAIRGESSSTPAPGPQDVPGPQEVKPVLSGVSYNNDVNPWAADETSTEPAVDEEEVEQIPPEVLYKSEFKKVWRNWSRLSVDWIEHYPDLKATNGPDSQYDLVHDLMPLDMGVLYRKIILSDPNEKVYGKLPLMASCSSGQIGALNAESFCERVISGANLVLDDGNTLLGDEELSMLVVLRMNREFMEYMRANYNAESRQDFASTVVG